MWGQSMDQLVLMISWDIVKLRLAVRVLNISTAVDLHVLNCDWISQLTIFGVDMRDFSISGSLGMPTSVTSGETRILAHPLFPLS